MNIRTLLMIAAAVGIFLYWRKRQSLNGLGASRYVVTRGGVPVDSGLNFTAWTGGAFQGRGSSVQDFYTDAQGAIGRNPGKGSPGYADYMQRFQEFKRNYTLTYEDGTQERPYANVNPEGAGRSVMTGAVVQGRMERMI